ncbi:dolichyl-phosphate-mannose-protein mannosyltransferase [Rhizoctonia solani]|uniref:Dolichyl-phosphate-mannose--protein mannosyltransferase n=1 Tax=Rhizoctonia solani TaxID=456999 RepID=A0A8H8NL72_9AGAM|nr:dolichyl-phosphate-mannose-protein mannosyltransferase [Rhizoctonia solani]QRW15811.1 dolichyl-phosphate-mannose-protein mannosyltransferase [Rhizoctonia solani]
MASHRRPRAPSPTPDHLTASYAPTLQPRFPVRPNDHLDADERRANAQPGKLRKHHIGGLNLAPAEWKILVIVVIIASFVRLYKISYPDSVVFDEVHFGNFASKYIKTRYFVDVHPPLAKLLLTLAAFVGGFDGHFDFKEIGKAYDENTPYVLMRLLPAIMGVAVVPLTYLTLRGLDCRATTALLGAFLVTFENGLITQSRLILLDSPLIFFTALTAFFWVGFSNEDTQRPFTEEWWTWLALTGLSLGAVVSCKWVGLFTIATVGVCTLRQLWLLLGDLKVTPRLFIKHFMARALCLILLPILFYMAMFEIHFAILQNSGDGDGFMSAAFMHTLGGRGMSDTFADVALGSAVTLRHVNTQGGYLHSHLHTYPGGSKQQQITLYPHIDGNNDWRILNGTFDGATDFDWTTEPISQIRNGQTIRLEHIATQKRLHSHDVRPPVSDVDFQNEVSAYGYPGFQGDANDNWIVEIEEGAGRGQTVKTLKPIKLPDWAFEQQEVTCNKNAVRENSVWYIETNNHEKLGDDAEKVNYKPPGFLSKFLELQQVMWTTNAGLTDRHAFDSRPSSWPRLRRGINFWVKDHKQIYLIGNPFVWYMSTISVLLYAVFRGFLILREKRGYKDFHNTTLVKYDQLCAFLATGWVLHYFPFFLMSRQLFLHHYFPALYFAILMSCAVFDAVTANLKPRVRLQIAGVVLIFVLWNYMSFSPLTYGTPWTRSKCESSKWLKSWDFACGDFYESYDQYSTIPPSTPSPSAVQPVVVGDEHGGRPAVVVDAPQVQKPKEDAQTTDSVIIPIEPGHDVFAGDKVDNKPISLDRVAEPLPKEALIHTSDTAGSGPGPDNDADQQEELRSIEEEAKKKVPAGVQEKIAQAQQSVIEKVVEAKEKLKDHAKAQNEEERVRQELYGNEKKEAE